MKFQVVLISPMFILSECPLKCFQMRGQPPLYRVMQSENMRVFVFGKFPQIHIQNGQKSCDKIFFKLEVFGGPLTKMRALEKWFFTFLLFSTFDLLINKPFRYCDCACAKVSCQRLFGDKQSQLVIVFVCRPMAIQLFSHWFWGL